MAITLGGMVSDILQVGKDIFLQREATKSAVELQAATIEGQKQMMEAQQAQSGIAMQATTKNLIYIGGALIAIAIFIAIFKSVRRG